MAPNTDPTRSPKTVAVGYGEISIPAEPGWRLLDAILAAGIDHRHVCGGNGFCTSCRVEVISLKEGLSPVSPLERERLGSRAGELRLACQAVVRGPVEVRVPAPSPIQFSPFDDELDEV